MIEDGRHQRDISAEWATIQHWWTVIGTSYACVWLLIVIWAASRVAITFTWLLVLAVIAIALVAEALLRACSEIGFVIVSREGFSFFVRRFLLWSITPVLGLLSMIAVWTEAPLLARFYLGASDMERQAEAALHGIPLPAGSDFGLFTAKHVIVHGDLVRITLTDDMGLMGELRAGVYYAPFEKHVTTPPAVGTGEEEIEHWVGPWYRFVHLDSL